MEQQGWMSLTALLGSLMLTSYLITRLFCWCLDEEKETEE